MKYNVHLKFSLLLLFLAPIAQAYNYKAIIELPECKSLEAKKYVCLAIAKIKQDILSDIFVVRSNNLADRYNLEFSPTQFTTTNKKLIKPISIEIYYKANTAIKNNICETNKLNYRNFSSKYFQKYTESIIPISTTEAYKSINYEIENFFCTAYKQEGDQINSMALYIILPSYTDTADLSMKVMRIHSF